MRALVVVRLTHESVQSIISSDISKLSALTVWAISPVRRVDERPAVVLDDVQNANFSGFRASVADGVPVFVKITNTRKRKADREYVKETPYRTTTVNGLVTPPGLLVLSVTVDRPAPSTPPDSLYRYPTAPDGPHLYGYDVPDAAYAPPKTVYEIQGRPR
jgi:hypothetical protein